MEPTIYLVKMCKVEGEGELGPYTEIVIQLSDIEGKWFADFRQNSWPYANLALLKGLKEKGLRFLGSLPHVEKQFGIESFWVVTEPLVPPRPDTHRRDHDGY